MELIHLSSPGDANVLGKVHGGVLLKLIDEAAYAAACKHSGHACVTASVNKVNFFHPIHIGDLITIMASVNYVGRTSMEVGVRVESQDLKTGKIEHTTSSHLTMVALDEKGRPIEVPDLIAESEKEKIRYEHGKARYLQRRKGNPPS